MVRKGEKILWKGRPNKRCFILEGIFNPLFFVALIWISFDSFFIAAYTAQGQLSASSIYFFILHMTPVWAYIGGIIFVFRRYKHTKYIITDKGVYVSGGLFSYTCNMKPFTELARVNIHISIIDQIIGVGDVVLTSNNIADLFGANVRTNGGETDVGITIADIKDYRRVFEIINIYRYNVSE